MEQENLNELTDKELDDVTGFPYVSNADLAKIISVYAAQEGMRSYEGNKSFLNKLMAQVDAKNYLNEMDAQLLMQELAEVAEAQVESVPATSEEDERRKELWSKIDANNESMGVVNEQPSKPLFQARSGDARRIGLWSAVDDAMGNIYMNIEAGTEAMVDEAMKET